VNTESSLHFYLRILLAVLLTALLGLSPVPHAVNSLLENAHQSIVVGDYQNASIYLAAAAQYFPWMAELNKKAAQYAYQSGDPESTIQYLERSGTISHLNPDDLLLLGDAYFKSGDSFMAEAIWKRVTQLVDSIPAYQRLADMYIQQGDYPSATAVLQEMLSLYPSDTHLYYQLGLLYSVSDPLQALPFLAQAQQIDPANSQKAGVLPAYLINLPIPY
jgi:tetratricopeptide (TPR) repeat protein